MECGLWFVEGACFCPTAAAQPSEPLCLPRALGQARRRWAHTGLCCLARLLAALQRKRSRREEDVEEAGSSLTESTELLGLQVLGGLGLPTLLIYPGP